MEGLGKDFVRSDQARMLLPRVHQLLVFVQEVSPNAMEQMQEMEDEAQSARQPNAFEFYTWARVERCGNDTKAPTLPAVFGQPARRIDHLERRTPKRPATPAPTD
jgi:hypothetical protein